MCHVMLLMPALALPLFWALPLAAAGPLYAAITVASALLYWRIVTAHKRRPHSGAESLIGTQAQVVSKLAEPGPAQYLVRSRGELWSASSPAALQPGNQVRIAAVEGIRLVVAPDGGDGGEVVLAEPARHGQGKDVGRCH